jgi:hypothetical protein
VRPWLARLYPWLAAPAGSGCYALYTAAYVTSFDPLLLPLMLAVFGYALLAVPQVCRWSETGPNHRVGFVE